MLLTQAIHTLDLMLSFAGAAARGQRLCRNQPGHRMETEDIAVAAIRYANGAVGTVSATTCAYPGLPERIELIGEAGVAVLDGTVLKVAFHSGEVLEAGDADRRRRCRRRSMAFPHAYHQALISDFLDAIRDGRDPADLRRRGTQGASLHRHAAGLERPIGSDIGRRVK